MRTKCFWPAACALSLILLSVQAWSAEVGEWTLKIRVDEARIHLKPDPSSPAVSTAAKGTTLKSFAKEGTWFRVILEPGREGLLVLGYLSSSDAEVVEKAEQKPDFWEQAAGEYRGFGIGLKLGGGFYLFNGGDLRRGVSGMFERAIDSADSLGAVIEDTSEEPLRSVFLVSGDVFYRVKRRLGVGLRFEYGHVYADSSLRINFGHPGQFFTTWSSSSLSIIALRPGLYYDLPLSRLLTISLNGGPALYLVNFEYGRDFRADRGNELIRQKVKAHGLGLQGGAGLELRMYRRSAFFLEVQGRYARISDFKGDEAVSKLRDLQFWTSVKKGFLYYEDEGPHPGLAVLEGESSGQGNVRRAILDLSGVSFAAGFRVLF